MTQAQQQAMTPDQALSRLADGNERFMGGKSLNRDYVSEAKASASGQYPFAVVLSCLDSRSIPEIVFDQGIGNLFVARVAGNYAPVDIIGSMEFATKVAGAKLIVVMGHTECGAVKGACDNVELGNLTTVIQAIRPAVDDPSTRPQRTSKNKEFLCDAVDVSSTTHGCKDPSGQPDHAGDGAVGRQDCWRAGYRDRQNLPAMNRVFWVQPFDSAVRQWRSSRPSGYPGVPRV